MQRQQNKMRGWLCALLLGCFTIFSGSALAAANNGEYLKLWAPLGWTFVPGSVVYGAGTSSDPIPNFTCPNDILPIENPYQRCAGVPYAGESCKSGFNVSNTEYVIQDIDVGTTKTPQMYGPFFTIDMKNSDASETVTLLVFKGGAGNDSSVQQGILVSVVPKKGNETFSQPNISSWVWQGQATKKVTGGTAPTDCSNSNGCAAVVQLFYEIATASNTETAKASSLVDCAPNIFPKGVPGFGGQS